MSEEVMYHYAYIPKANWQVGYHYEKDCLFLYLTDEATDLVTVVYKGGVDAIGFPEFMKWYDAELLGEL